MTSNEAEFHLNNSGHKVLWIETGTMSQLCDMLQKKRVLKLLGVKIPYPLPYFLPQLGYQVVDGDRVVSILPSSKEYEYVMTVYDIWRTY